MKCGRVFRSLQGSLRSIWFQDQELQKKCSYRTLLDVVRRKLVAIQRGKPRLDVCVVCASWDAVASRRVARILGEIRLMLAAAGCDLVQQFDETIAPNLHEGRPYNHVESFKYFAELTSYYKSKTATRAFLTP